MNRSSWEILACIAIALCCFIAGCRAGTESGYNNGFIDGAETAEEYAKECYNELNYETEDHFGVDIDKADAILQEYDADGFKYVTENELIDAQYALSYFSRNLWDYLTDIREVSLELGEIPSD